MTERVDASVHGYKDGDTAVHDDVLEKQIFAVSRYFYYNKWREYTTNTYYN